MKKSKWILILAVLLVAGYTAVKYGPKVRSRGITVKEAATSMPGASSSARPDETLTVKVFFPEGLALRVERRVVERTLSQKKVLKGVLAEFLKGPAEAKRQVVPNDAVVLGVYLGNDGIAYVNLSEEFRRNFHGDAADEYLLLRSLYETVIANAKADDVKLLIDNRETDTVGGHFYADRPLKQLVTQEMKFD